jgi:CubicO group peptidase (beta-lactamase class C family)
MCCRIAPDCQGGRSTLYRCLSDWLASHNTIMATGDTIADLVAKLRYLEPLAGFRQTFLYNNTMFTLAGHVVERLSGMPFAEFVKQRIFLPIGLHSATYDVLKDAPELLAAAQYTHDEAGSFVLAFHLAPDASKDHFGPCGGAVMSSKDVCKWLMWRSAHVSTAPRSQSVD